MLRITRSSSRLLSYLFFFHTIFFLECTVICTTVASATAADHSHAINPAAASISGNGGATRGRALSADRNFLAAYDVQRWLRPIATADIRAQRSYVRCPDGSVPVTGNQIRKRFVSVIRGGGGDENSQDNLPAGAVNRLEVPPAEALSRYPTLETPGGLVRMLDYVGTASFAMSGTAVAGMRGMNLLGCLVVATMAATGGGTTRDLLLGQTPVFWMDETEYLGICIVTALVTFVLWPILSKITVLSSMGTGMDGWLSQAIDTIGLGSFCVVGTQHGIRRGVHPLITIVISCITCSGGGIMRDIVTGSPPTVLSAHAQIYVTTTAIGSAVYLLARRRSNDPLARVSAGFFCVVILRILACIYNITLPSMV